MYMYIMFITHWNAITCVHARIVYAYEHGVFPHWSTKIVAHEQLLLKGIVGQLGLRHRENRQVTAVALSLVWV